MRMSKSSSWKSSNIWGNSDLNSVKEIFLCGDDVSWIKKGLEIIPRAIFILDCFHFAKRIRKAPSRMVLQRKFGKPQK
ncbi:UPF0236 family transposase-like protein [Candidatus Caldatribacterium saccharofermentans]|uniref:UPF0236 family transposase-like protein n=1 Tax=Candidatus Caldatribacterium saccharofermentans TaxID=1454753 RepID=UPI003D0723A4